MDDQNYCRCEKCGSKILKGDVRHIAGYDVCEYCYDGFSDSERDEADY